MYLLSFILLSSGVLIVPSTCQEFTVTPITTSSGLYYEKIGDVLLSNNNWQFVTSVDYRGYLLFYEYLFAQAKKIEEFCEKTALKECAERYNTIRSNLDKIEETDEALANFLGITVKPRRVKRFFGSIGRFFSSVGRGVVGFARTIFGGGGGGGQIDLSAYDRQLGELRSGQSELSNQLNLQRTAFLVDSERKNFEIEWLKRTQGQIQDKVVQLETTFQKDSEQKGREIKELQSMLGETQEKLKMQEAIQKKLVSQVDQIEKKLLQVDADIKNIYQKIAENAARIDLLELKVKLNTISIDFNFLMDRFEKEQKTLFEVIKNANRGSLDPYILTPLNLVQMLQNIQPNLPEQEKFPFYPNIENANKLYNIIKPSVYLYNSTIIFILEIPLVHAKNFNFHKITSLPIPVDKNKFGFILPQEPFLIIDNDYREYMLMSNKDFKDFCKEVDKDKHLCRQIQHISQAYSSQDCEVLMFKLPKKIPDTCNKRLIHLDYSLFFQLQQPMTWIYTVPESEQLTFSCGKTRVNVLIEGAGFIRTNEECMVRTPNFVLTFLQELSKRVESNYSASLNFTNFIDKSKVDKIATKSVTRKQIILPFDYDELSKISFSLNETESSLAALYYTLLVVFIVLILVFAYLVYKKKVNLDRILTILRIKKINEPPPIPPKDSDREKLQIRVKVNKNNENIQNISVHEDPSTTDPDAEYLTVRFKVKKDEIPNKTDNEVYSNFVSIPEEVDPDQKHESWLNELRKLKPNKC